MPVKAETKKRADEFINSMERLFNTIKQFKEEGEALKSKNKTIAKFIEKMTAQFDTAMEGCDDDEEEEEEEEDDDEEEKEIKIKGVLATKIYTEAYRQHTAKVKEFTKKAERKEIRPLPNFEPPVETVIDQEGKKSRQKSTHMNCPVCKRYMTVRHYRENHSKAKVCVHIEDVREDDGAEVPKFGEPTIRPDPISKDIVKKVITKKPADKIAMKKPVPTPVIEKEPEPVIEEPKPAPIIKEEPTPVIKEERVEELPRIMKIKIKKPTKKLVFIVAPETAEA